MATDETNQPRGERLRILIGFARPHQRALLLGLALSLVATAMALATPMVTKWVLDSLSGGVSLAGPIALLLGLLVVGSVVGLAQWGSSWAPWPSGSCWTRASRWCGTSCVRPFPR